MSLSQPRLCSFYSHRWSELLPPFFQRRNACRGKDERKSWCYLPSSSSAHSVPGCTPWLFPMVGIPFALKSAIQILKKHNADSPTRERVYRSAVNTGRPTHEHRLVLVSSSSSLFIPLSPPRLKSELSYPIGWVAWSCDRGVKTQNFKSMPERFICLQRRE